MIRNVAFAASPCLALLVACASTPAPPAAPERVSLPSSTPSATAAPSAFATSNSALAAPNSADAATPPPPAPPQAPPEPAPLSADEQKEAERLCRPLTLAMQKTKGSGKTPLEALHEALKKPPSAMKKDDLARCTELLERGIRTYLAAAKEAEATVIMKQIGRAMAGAFDASDGKLCPSSERPIPADRALVERGPYVSTAADWSTPAWSCLGLELTGQAQRFQYEVSVDQAAKTFVIIARGVPGEQGRWVELRQKGRVGAKAIELEPVERR